LTKPTERIELRRVIPFRSYVGLGLGAIIGMGWVVYSGSWLEAGGPVGAMLGFLVGGLLLIPVGLAYAELTPAIPVAGGEIGFSFRAFGPTAAFFSCWFLAFAYTFLCPFETVAMGWLLEKILPVIQTPMLYSIGGDSISTSSILPGLLLGGGMVVVNLLGVRASARFQLVTTAAMLVCVIVFATLAFVRGSFANFLPLFAGSGASVAVVPASILSVVVGVPFWLSGFDTIPQAAEEAGTDLRPRLLGLAVMLSIFLGTLFYLLVVGSVAMAMPWQQSVNLDMPTAGVFRAAFGQEWIVKLVLGAAFLGLLSSLNGFFLAATRVLFSAGRGGLLPRWFGGIDKRRKTPRNAILFVGLFAMAGPFVGKAILDPIVHVGSLAFAAAWLLTCMCATRLRRAEPRLIEPYRLTHVGVLYVGAVVCTAIVLVLLLPGSPEQLQWPSEYGILLAWFAIGYVCHVWQVRRGGMSAEEQRYQILGEGPDPASMSGPATG
jgi:APA family basic amino acid/polyamine antiporter